MFEVSSSLLILESRWTAIRHFVPSTSPFAISQREAGQIPLLAHKAVLMRVFSFISLLYVPGCEPGHVQNSEFTTFDFKC
jgi:hypothetical protein